MLGRCWLHWTLRENGSYSSFVVLLAVLVMLQASPSEAPPPPPQLDGDLLRELDSGPLQSVRLSQYPRPHPSVDLAVWRRIAPHVQASPKGEVDVWLRGRTGFGRQVLRAHNIGGARGGLWQEARLDTQTLRRLQEEEGIEVRAAVPHRLFLEMSTTDIRAREVAGSLPREGLRGQGVLLGIIDTGIDLSHPAFLGDDGRTRVVAVWDQDRRGIPPPGFTYGHFCSAKGIREATCTVDDPVGHGTHVAGIAAGREGVAPAADIAVVRSERFTRLADAVLFLTHLAESRGQPLAINVSVGAHYGAHDGRTPFEQFLEGHLKPGQILVAAAGNDADAQMHLGVRLEAKPVRTLLQNVPWGRNVEITIELWSEPTAVVTLALELWRDDAPALEVPLTIHSDDLLEGVIRDNSSVIAEVAYGVSIDPGSSLARRTIIIHPKGRPARDGRLALRLSGHGKLHSWVHQDNYAHGTVRFTAPRQPGWVAGDAHYSIAVPATGKAAIAVASYVTRTEWVSENRTLHQLRNPVGSLSPFSSRGPSGDATYTGFKPELSAPGSIIVSARAMSVAPGTLTIDEERTVLQGTSMAAPHVAGVVALMLQQNPTLDVNEARRILTHTARVDEHTQNVPNHGWGYGKVDAQAAVDATEPATMGCAAMPAAHDGIYILVGVLVWRLSRRRSL